MKINSINFRTRIQRLLKEIPESTMNELEVLGNKMHEDIVSTITRVHSFSWQAAVSNDGTAYFTKPNSSPGLIDIIDATKQSHVAVVYMQDKVSLGFGHMPTLDFLAPYWDFFERDVDRGRSKNTNVRERKSDTYGFVPKVGTGQRKEGYMSKVTPEGIAKKTHPGVFGVNF